MEGPDPRLIVCFGGTREQNSAGEAEARARCVSQSTPTREEALERLLREASGELDGNSEVTAGLRARIRAALEGSCPDTPPSC
jgi:hypothetical protein